MAHALTAHNIIVEKCGYGERNTKHPERCWTSDYIAYDRRKDANTNGVNRISPLNLFFGLHNVSMFKKSKTFGVNKSFGSHPTNTTRATMDRLRNRERPQTMNCINSFSEFLLFHGKRKSPALCVLRGIHKIHTKLVQWANDFVQSSQTRRILGIQLFSKFDPL